MIEGRASIEPAHPGEVLREDSPVALSMGKTASTGALGTSRGTLHDVVYGSRPGWQSGSASRSGTDAPVL